MFLVRLVLFGLIAFHSLLTVVSNLAMSKLGAPSAVVPNFLCEDLIPHSLDGLLGEEWEWL